MLGIEGQIILVSFLAAVLLWIIKPAGGTYTIGLLAVFLGGTIAGFEMADLAVGFVNPSLWLLIAAMFLGHALLKTGLGKRLVILLLSKFKPSYFSIIIGWVIIGIAFSFLTPSITVRFLIIVPIAVSIADACGMEAGSRGRSLTVISAWVAALLPGITLLNGSLYGPAFTAFLPRGAIAEMATAGNWFKIIGPPFLLMALILLVAVCLVLRPEEKLKIAKADMIKMYRDLGPATKDERNCMMVFAIILAGLAITGPTGFTTSQILMFGFFLLLLSGVLKIPDISTGISWDVILFFGVLMGFSHIFEISGVSAWISPALESLVIPLTKDPLIFAIGLYVLCSVLRLVDLTQSWITASILSLLTPVLYSDFGYHPLVCLAIFIFSGNHFLFRYNQPWLPQVESLVGTGGWSVSHLRKVAIMYALLSFPILAASVPYWRFIGAIRVV